MFVDEQPNQLRANLVHYFSNYLKGGYAYTMPEELFHQYEMEFEEGNEWVREKYFPERDRLFPKATYPDIVEVGLSQDELESIANMIASMWLDKQTQPNSKAYSVALAIRHLKQWVKRIL